MNTLYTKAIIKEKVDGEFTAVASSEIEDRQGEVVVSKGWDLKNFQTNPILLWMHDHTKPLGKASKVWIDRLNSQLKFKGKISDATEWGRAALQLMDEGILNSFSVGFRALEMDGNRITKAELFEISLVTVPANPEARLLAAKSLKNTGFDAAIIKQFTEEDKDEIISELSSRLTKAEETADKALEQAETAVKGLQYLAPHRSKPVTVAKRLELSKMIAKTADKMIVDKSAVYQAKIIKRTSEKLIRDLKGDL